MGNDLCAWVRPTLAHVPIGGVDVAAAQYSVFRSFEAATTTEGQHILPMAVEFLLPQSQTL